MQQLDFFNTIHISGTDLLRSVEQAGHQNERVLEIIRKAFKATPLEVSRIYNRIYKEAPVTSIRRSMTVLTKQGKLEKCDQMKIEKYGQPNHYWKINCR